jgi:hypothetical protein
VDFEITINSPGLPDSTISFDTSAPSLQVFFSLKKCLSGFQIRLRKIMTVFIAVGNTTLEIQDERFTIDGIFFFVIGQIAFLFSIF